MANDIRSKVGVARDLAIQKAVNFINSELVQGIIEKIPESWRESFVKLLGRLKDRASAAGEKN